MTELLIKEYFDSFLSFLSCQGNKELSWFNQDFIILKHTKHTSYIDRMSGTSSCNTYYLLVNVGITTPDAVKYGHLRKEAGVWVFPNRLVDEHRRRIQKIINTNSRKTVDEEVPKLLEHWQPFRKDSSCWDAIKLRLYKLEVQRVIDSDQKKTEIDTTNKNQKERNIL